MSEKVLAKSGPKRALTAVMLERGMTEAVIGRALVSILEDFVGLVDLLELVLGVLVAGIAIRWQFIACLRNAALMSASLAVRSTDRTS